jgi:hypothetical protein
VPTCVRFEGCFIASSQLSFSVHGNGSPRGARGEDCALHHRHAHRALPAAIQVRPSQPHPHLWNPSQTRPPPRELVDRYGTTIDMLSSILQNGLGLRLAPR